MAKRSNQKMTLRGYVWTAGISVFAGMISYELIKKFNLPLYMTALIVPAIGVGAGYLIREIL